MPVDKMPCYMQAPAKLYTIRHAQAQLLCKQDRHFTPCRRTLNALNSTCPKYNPVLLAHIQPTLLCTPASMMVSM
jgi:hypothetical protein